MFQCKLNWFYLIVLFLSFLNVVLSYGANPPYQIRYGRQQSKPWQWQSTAQKTNTTKNSNKNNNNGNQKYLIKVYEAKNLEFGFPTERERERALESGEYNPESPVPIDVDVYYQTRSGQPKIFITIPRFGEGVPYSLAYLTDVMRPNGLEIQPYPNYDYHSSHGANCDGLTSVYRVQIDTCGNLWVLDSGEIDFVQHCAPQIIVFDLATDQLIHRYRLPENMYKSNISRFVTPLIDFVDAGTTSNCEQAFVYMADPTGVGFVVYNVADGESWRIENKYTYPNPDFGTHTIAGESFELLDGTFALAVTPKNLRMRRYLYFHSLSNDMEIALPLDVLNNATNWGNGITSSLAEFVPLGRRGVQCAASAMTSQGFLLCGHLEPIGLYAWNIRTPYTEQNRILVAENRETLQFISGLKVIKNPAGKEEVWMMSNRLQRSFGGSINFNEINYRIQKCGVDELLLNKECTGD